MTEMSPVGSTGAVKPELEGLPHEDILALKAKQGWAPFGVEMRITDDDDQDLPWDGVKFGHLKVSGFAVAKSYFKGEGGEILDEKGFFDTGDVATIDPYGYVQITDRAKDVIKSGGEWISSIDIENIAVGHPDVAEAAVIGVAHPKWDERPLLIIVPKEGKTPDRVALLDFLNGRIAKWWMPDDVQLIEEIPHTATGKINKVKLREKFADYRLPTS
jgi:acyl-CoA synthetase (AMP-forming)/AMP-acid ligase II